MDEIADGWLFGAGWRASPNCNRRPAAVDLLVIHNISLPPGEFGTGLVAAFFCNRLDCSLHPSLNSLRDVRVSAHLFIERDGAVTQFVSFDQCAWHAGVSHFQDRENCNNFSIGIELEGEDDRLYTEQQYSILVRVTRSLRKQYPLITVDRIVGHCDIAPERKTDPGSAFDWNYYRGELSAAEEQSA